MISDSQSLKDIQAAWETVRIAQAMVETNQAWALSHGAPLTDEFINLSNSMVLIFAFSVLEHTLAELRDENVFGANRSNLGSLMHTSKHILPWVSFDLIDTGRSQRNKIAHERKYLPPTETYKYGSSLFCMGKLN